MLAYVRWRYCHSLVAILFKYAWTRYKFGCNPVQAMDAASVRKAGLFTYHAGVWNALVIQGH
jgi:hypothetical protein